MNIYQKHKLTLILSFSNFIPILSSEFIYFFVCLGYKGGMG